MKPVTAQAPVDPHVKIPAAVAAAAAKADAALAAASPTPAKAPDPAPAGDDLIKIVPPAATPQVTTVTVSDAPPSQAPVSGATPPAPVTPQGNPDEQTWEQKARSAEGRYAAQVRINASLQDQITNLTNLIETLSSARQSQPEPVTTPKPVASLVTAEEVEAYGPGVHRCGDAHREAVNHRRA
jgi:hypothetical protein